MKNGSVAVLKDWIKRGDLVVFSDHGCEHLKSLAHGNYVGRRSLGVVARVIPPLMISVRWGGKKRTEQYHIDFLKRIVADEPAFDGTRRAHP